MMAKQPGAGTVTAPLAPVYKPTYRDEHALVGHFIRVLEERLAGRESVRRINAHPLDWCLLGVLGPQKDGRAPIEDEPDQPDVDEKANTAPPAEPSASTSAPAAGPVTGSNKSNGQEVEDAAATPKEKPDEQRSRRRPPSALGFEVLLAPDADGYISLRVSTSFCVFTKHTPTMAEQRSLPAGSPLAEAVKRWPIDVESFVLRFKPSETQSIDDGGIVQQAIDHVLNGAFSRPDADYDWPAAGRPKVTDQDALKDEKAFTSFITDYAGSCKRQRWSIFASVQVRATVRPDGLVRVGCYVRNDTAEMPQGTPNRGYRNAFLTISDAQLDAKIDSGELHAIEILPVPQDYQYDRRVWAVGHNASVDVDRDQRILRTRALARYEQLRIVTRDTPPARFAELADDPFAVLIRIRDSMQVYLRDWRAKVIGQNSLGLDEAALAECVRDCDGFADEIQRFSSGIAALAADARLLTAFKAANQIFERLAKGYDAWRLFQIVFFVTQLPALAIREGITSGQHGYEARFDWSDCLDWGDVLWFRTGGGKTEAYLGLACCAMLYDRLRGKSLGVSAWLRLPLRMLSIQQLQRAMRVIWETEKERKALLGERAAESDQIRLGYFVGSTVTPNSLSEEVMQRYLRDDALERLRVIPDCPACETRGGIKVTADLKAMRFRHACADCGAELPLDVSDDEVYRHLPALVVGTVDKTASVGQQMKFGMLWGGVRWRCPHHGYALGQYCSVFGCKLKPKDGHPVTPHDPSPSLHIQDELHLLQEELGAFAGHYETLIRYCEEELSHRPSKVIAATATIEGFERQVQHLYGVKHGRRFPGRGFNKYASFYAEPDVDPHGTQKTARAFVAFKCASLSPADASAKVTEILQAEVTNLMRNPHLALALLVDARTPEDVGILLTHYTTTLNYVGSLARGSRVSQALEDASSRVRPNQERDLNVEYTSSRASSAEVTAVVHRIENPPAWDDPAFLDALVATNMISHGVDLERVNLMTMDGVPEETAEYIQASSRSGRRHVGLIVVVLADYSLRAASIYHRFLEYHDHLDRMVSPVPVNRFAKYAAERTLPGVTMGLVYGLHAAQSGDVKLNKRHEVSALFDRLGSQVMDEVKKAYALGTNVYDERLEKGLLESLEEGLDKARMHLRGSHEDKARDALRPAPMTSLRDVEAGVPFWPDGNPKLLIYVERTRE